MASIGVVARQTGIGTHTLRKWEERFGFPQPSRREFGQREYSDEEVGVLLAISRRTAAGERVGQVIRELTQEGWQQSPLRAKGRAPDPNLPVLGEMLAALGMHRVAKLTALFGQERKQRSALSFVEEIAAPLTYMVGEEWANGRLPVHCEHVYSTLLESFLARDVGLASTVAERPAILLTTPAGEQHTLGLAMVQTVLAEAGVDSLRLSAHLPLPEIVAAAKAYRVQAVGLSASLHYPPRLLCSLILDLRAALPSRIALWLGGSGMNGVARLPAGASVFSSMSELLAACVSSGLTGGQRDAVPGT